MCNCKFTKTENSFPDNSKRQELLDKKYKKLPANKIYKLSLSEINKIMNMQGNYMILPDTGCEYTRSFIEDCLGINPTEEISSIEIKLNTNY